MAVDGSGFALAYVAESTDCGSGEVWAIMMRAGVCIFYTGSEVGTMGVSGDGRMSMTFSIISLYAVGSKFGGLAAVVS